MRNHVLKREKVKSPAKETSDMEKEKMFLKTIELATNEIQKDKFEHYRIQQKAKKKKNQNTTVIIFGVLILLTIVIFILK